MSAGDHVPRRRGPSMYHQGQDQQYNYFLRDLDNEHGSSFSFPEMIPSHDTTAAPSPLIFNDGGLTIDQSPTDDINSFLTSSFSNYGLFRQPAAAELYDLQLGSGTMGSQLVNKDRRTSGTATPLTGNSSISSPSTGDEDAATEDQEDLASSSGILICNKGDLVDNMDDEEPQQQQQKMDIKRDNDNDDNTATAAGGGGGDESKKLLSKGRKKGEKRPQREPRFAFLTKSEVDHLEDGYRWRKYGQKAVKNSPYPRSYYRCTTQKCGVKKRVERSYQDPSIVVTTYEGQHTHPSPATVRGSSHILVPPPDPSALTMPLSSFHRGNYHALKLHQLMNAASAHGFNPGSTSVNDNNTGYLGSLVPTSDPSLQRQQLHQVLLPAAVADQYGLVQDNVAIPSTFNINSNGRLP